MSEKMPSPEEQKVIQEKHMTEEEIKMSEEREKFVQKRETNRVAMMSEFEPYLKSRNKSLSELSDAVRNKLLDILTNDAKKEGYGWHEVRGLDIKDNIAAYIKYFDTGGFFDVHDKNIDLKIITEDYVLEQKLAESDRDKKEFKRYNEYTTVDIVEVNTDENIINIRLSGKNVPEITLKVRHGIKKKDVGS